MRYIYKAQMVRIVDGDTIDFDVDLGFRIRVGLRTRLYGVDTPERGQEGWQEAIDFCKNWFFVAAEKSAEGHTLVEIYKDKGDKYGRYLADVYFIDGETRELRHLNAELVEEGLAVERVY